jgi:hypothetical protein
VSGDSVGALSDLIYLVKGESDAPPEAAEQRAPANGWCDLLHMSISQS